MEVWSDAVVRKIVSSKTGEKYYVFTIEFKVLSFSPQFSVLDKTEKYYLLYSFFLTDYLNVR